MLRGKPGAPVFLCRVLKQPYLEVAIRQDSLQELSAAGGRRVQGGETAEGDVRLMTRRKFF